MQLILDVRGLLLSFIISGNAKEGEDGSRENDIRSTHNVIVVVVDLFLEFLSGVITTLDQLKTRVPTVRGVHNVESLNKGMCNGGDS